MDRKAYLLSSLKKQVLNLKTQLDQIERQKKQNKSLNKSIHESSRFNSNTYDSSYLDKGVKKFPLQDKCKNIVQVINQKSAVEKAPKLSPFRKAQYERTKQNFSLDKNPFSSQRKISPNPLTGQGYSDKKKGIKTVFPKKQPQSQQKRQTQRRHFSFYFY